MYTAARHPAALILRAYPIARRLAQAAALITLAILLALLPLYWAALLTAGAAAALLILRRPWLVWLLPAAALPMAGTVHLGFGPLTAIELLLALAGFIWLLSGATRGSLRVTHHPLLAPLLLYLAALLLSSIDAADLDEAAKEMVKWIEFSVVLMLVPTVLTPGRTRWLVAAMLTAALGQALLGLYQFIFRIGPDWFVVLDRFMRAGGSFRQPNPFAGYLGLTLPVALSLTLWGVQTSASKQRTLGSLGWTLAYAAATGVIALGLLASWSRGAWIGAAAGVIVVLLFFSRRSALWVAGIASAVLIAALLGALNPAWVPAAVSARLQDLPAYLGLGNVLNQPVTDENFAVLERVAHWVAALRMFALSPWLGVGPGNYAAFYPLVRLPLWEEPLGHAHNAYLNVLAETGLVGLANFLTFWGGAVAWTWLKVRGNPAMTSADTWNKALAVGVLGVLAHLAVHSIFDNLFVQGIYLHLAFWFAALVVVESHPPSRSSESDVPSC